MQPPRSDGRMSALLADAPWIAARTNVTFAKSTLTVTGRAGDGSTVVDFTLYDIPNNQGTDSIVYGIGEAQGMGTINAAHAWHGSINYHTPITLPPKRIGTVTVRMGQDSITGTFRFTIRRNADLRSPDSLVVSEGTFAVQRPGT